VAKQLGEEAAIGDDSNSKVARFTVTTMRPANCQSSAPRPAAGNRFLLVDIDLTTSSDPNNILRGFQVTTGWEFVDSAGNSSRADTSAALNCYAVDLPTQNLGPNRHYALTATVEVPAGRTGALILPYGESGWEWPISA
jgi:hypothetical protein